MSIYDLLEKFNITPSPIPNEGLMFKDFSKEGKSGHLGHGLVEYDKDSILAFYPNCSGVEGGHSGRGWMEYKRSVDGGKTWSEGIEFAYSRDVFENSAHRESAMVEKAVSPARNVIVALTLECDVSQTPVWEPYRIPKVVRSTDGGKTWDEGYNLGAEAGRVYDALFHDGKIFVMLLCNDASEDFAIIKKEHRYVLLVSEDEGKSFIKWSTMPFGHGRAYGSMEVLKDGGLIAYAYTREDNEQYLDYTISMDLGRSWSGIQRTFLSKKIRNPQLVRFRDSYFLHGRSGQHGEGSGHFVLYTSQDGIQWDAGTYMAMQTHGVGSYSNNLVVGKLYNPGNEKLLVMSSHAYEKDKTNIIYWWIE